MAPGRVLDRVVDNGDRDRPRCPQEPARFGALQAGVRRSSSRRRPSYPSTVHGRETAMTWAMSPAPEVDDRYLLRNLAWCGLCALSLEPAWISPGKRFYGCRNIHCPRPLVPADLLQAL